MKKILLSKLLILLIFVTGQTQEFAEKRVIIDSIEPTLGNNNFQNVEDLVYTKELNGQLHFISHIDGNLKLYKFENGEAVEIGEIGDLNGFIVDVFDHNADDLTDILGHFRIKLAESETEFGEPSSLSTGNLKGRIYRSGDFDSDGIIDILTRDVVFSGGKLTETIYIYYFNNDQSIKSVDSFFSEEELIGAQAIDLNKDGLFDYVYTQDVFADNRLIIQINNGDGTYSEQDIGVNNTASLISSGDFDNDSDIDIIITGFNGSNLEIITNDSGVFSKDEKIIDSERVFSLKIADMNNDTNLDLIFLENNNFDSLNVNIALGNGDGTFEEPETVGQVQFEGVLFTNSFEQAAEDWLSIYDYNQDGNIDIFVNAILEKSFVLFENKGLINSLEESNNYEILSVYPNPSSNVIHLKNHEIPNEIEIIDINGILQKSDKNVDQINISDLKNGMYILKLVTESTETRLVKIIKG